MGWWSRLKRFSRDMDPEYNPATGAHAGQLLWQRSEQTEQQGEIGPSPEGRYIWFDGDTTTPVDTIQDTWAIVRDEVGKLPPLNGAHYVDLVVRMNGEDQRYEADWIKTLRGWL